MAEITRFIRDCLDKVKKSQSFGILEIPELQKFLPYDDGDENGNGNGDKEYSNKEGLEETAKTIQKSESFSTQVVINPYKISIINDKGSESAGHEGGESNNGSGGSQGIKAKQVKGLQTRSYLVSQNNDKLVYKIIIKSKQDIRCNLKLIAIGEEGFEKLKISKVYDQNNGKYFYSENQIRHLQLSKNVQNEFNVEIGSEFKLSLKIEANVIQ